MLLDYWELLAPPPKPPTVAAQQLIVADPYEPHHTYQLTVSARGIARLRDVHGQATFTLNARDAAAAKLERRSAVTARSDERLAVRGGGRADVVARSSAASHANVAVTDRVSAGTVAGWNERADEQELLLLELL